MRSKGLIPFLLASALGGLFALVMPCVWPMIPITVNFFVKQGQAGKGEGKTTSLAIAYCLAIIGIFTGVGVFFSFFFSASFLQNLANNPWLNLVVAASFPGLRAQPAGPLRDPPAQLPAQCFRRGARAGAA